MKTLPRNWEVGMKVRYRESQEFGPSKGATGTIERMRNPAVRLPPDVYQVFWVRLDKGDGVFWTTPADVDWLGDGA